MAHRCRENKHQIEQVLRFFSKNNTDHFIAIKQNECLGARMMGGGFGGCTLNLVKRQETEHFINKINLEYKNNFGIMSQSYSFSLVDGLKSFVETT